MPYEKPKEVFIFGAGFSRPAGIPTQRELLSRLLELQPDELNEPRAGDFQSAKFEVADFLKEIFKRENRLEGITLEDFYTLIDLAIARKESLPPYSWEQLPKIRRKFDLCTLFLFNNSIRAYKGKFYQRFANKLIRRYGRGFATISINWDTLWDTALADELKSRQQRVNYGFDTLELSVRKAGVAAQSIRQKGGTLLLKLHGSFNWATCSLCHKVFLAGEEAVWLAFSGKVSCPACTDKTGLAEQFEGALEPRLCSLFLTPTMLKQLSGACLARTWELAHWLLTEAERITFVGYSLPIADFELRYLLRRSIKGSTRIRVVLNRRRHVRSWASEGDSTEERYRHYLGIPKRNIYHAGVESYFRKELGV